MDTKIVNSKLEIENSLERVVKELTGEELEAQVDVPKDLSKGDFTTNVAMATFGNIKSQMSNIKSPMDYAEKIIEHLKLDIGNLKFLDRVEVKAPGFINFWLSEKEILKGIEQSLSLAQAKKPISKELILEYGDLNPFKEPHIGHLRNLALGEALCRLLEFDGNKLIRANYEGDVGMHVAKCIWGILQIPNPKSQIQKIESSSLDKKAKFLGEAYALGAQKFETDENAKRKIISINNKIYSKDSKIIKIWEKGRKWSLEYFETLYKKLGIKYDNYYFESETQEVGQKIVKENTPRVFEKDDGALIFRADKYGLHTRVFVTKDNYATYEGKDLGLAILKNKDYPNADSIIMTANEQIDYFKVLLKALELVDEKIAKKTSHLSFGFVNLKEGKMSSRIGNVVSAFWLLEEVKKRLKKGFKQVSEEVLESISVGAVKWSMLKFSRESNISFSIDESIDLTGNSGPYMQYTYARIASLLGKSSKTDFEANSVKNWDEDLIALGRIICQFETVVKTTSQTFSPNILTGYLFTLAQKFNNYYEKEKIIGTEKETERLLVAKAVGEVLKQGLFLLGIETPERL